MTYHSQTQKVHVSFPRTKAWVNADLAASEEERIQGLHGRTELGPADGMLFRFPPQPPPLVMTMAQMKVPLDIIFIGEVGKTLNVLHIAHRLRAGRAAPVLGPAVRWVLEVPSGFARRHRIVCGDLVAFGDPA